MQFPTGGQLVLLPVDGWVNENLRRGRWKVVIIAIIKVNDSLFLCFSWRKEIGRNF